MSKGTKIASAKWEPALNGAELGSPGIPSPLQIIERAEAKVETMDETGLDSYNHLIVDETKDIPEPIPVISIAGEIIATPGNILTLSGQAKSGKSAFLQPVIASALSREVRDPFDDLEVSYCEGKTVLVIDTEQSLAKHKKSHLAILRRANLTRTPPNYLSYNFLGIDNIEERQKTLKGICEAANKRFGGIHLVILDGIADLINDVLDAKESTAIVNLIQSIASKYNCPVITIIHQNPSQGGESKERGHLGSHLQRKSESLLQISTSGDVSTLEPKLLRMAGRGKIPLIQFSYDPGRGYHVFVGHKEKEKQTINTAKYREWAKAVIKNNLPVSHTTMVERLEAETGKSYESARKYIKTMTELEIIKKTKDGQYTLSI